MADLICVDPKQVGHFWPHVEPLLRPAIEGMALDNFEDIEASILIGCGLVWIAWDGKILAAASTTLQRIGSDLICVLTACGGSDMRQWLPLLKKVEEYAKAEGCKAVRIFGRAGWKRVLEDYREIAVVIEKDLG